MHNVTAILVFLLYIHTYVHIHICTCTKVCIHSCEQINKPSTQRIHLNTHTLYIASFFADTHVHTYAQTCANMHIYKRMCFYTYIIYTIYIRILQFLIRSVEVCSQIGTLEIPIRLHSMAVHMCYFSLLICRLVCNCLHKQKRISQPFQKQKLNALRLLWVFERRQLCDSMAKRIYTYIHIM